MTCTRDLAQLPGIDALRQRLQQLAALESALAIDYGGTQFEFHPKWGRSSQMGAFKNGSGDHVFVHFTEAGCIILGFAHESSMSPYQNDPPKHWPGVLSSVPDRFQSSLDEPAFDIASTTFVIWRLAQDHAWQTGIIEYPDDPYGDGSEELLSHFICSSTEFAEWLADNYEVEINPAIVDSVFANNPLTDRQLQELHPGGKLQQLRQIVARTGYAIATGK